MAIAPSPARYLVLGLFAFAPLGACAPEHLEFPPEPPADARPAPRVDLPNELAPGAVAGAARPAPAAPAASTLAPSGAAADHAIEVGSGLVFDRDRFAEAVAEAARANDADASALPSREVFQLGGLRGEAPGFEASIALRVRELVARAAGASASGLTAADDVACGPSGDAACPKRFVQMVSRHNNGFAQAVAPLVRRLPAAAADLRVTLWKVERNGVQQPGAVTFHGRIGDRLVGIVFFLQLPSEIASGG